MLEAERQGNRGNGQKQTYAVRLEGVQRTLVGSNGRKEGLYVNERGGASVIMGYREGIDR